MNNGSLLDDRILVLDSAIPGSGPISPVIDQQLSPRSETYLTLDTNIRNKVDNNFIPIINAQNESSQQYVNDKYVNFTGREQITPTVVQQINLKGSDQFNNLSILDARTTTNQTTHYSYAGNAQREHDGTNFYRYEDNPRTTTNQTTQYSYAGNAQREHDGTNFYRYEDNPRTTTNQTTQYSYAGNPDGNNTSHVLSNRVQFTGTYHEYIDENGKKCIYRSPNSGVTNWGQKFDTLVEDYFPGSNGNTNIQLDPDEKQGFTLMRPDWENLNTQGNSTYYRAIPNGESFQQVDKVLIGEMIYNPNKVESVDNRQVSHYVIENLQNNPFSIYQRPNKRNNPSNINFFIDPNALDYSGISNVKIQNKPLEKIELPTGNVPVFGDSKKVYNPNEVIVNNNVGQPNSNYQNPFLFQNKQPQNSGIFMGGGYPGNTISANNTNPKILLDTDSLQSSRYLDYFSQNGDINTNNCVY